MCDSCNDPFHGLDDDLDYAPKAIAPVPANATLADAPIRYTHESRAAAAGHRYTEKCEACRGSGTWRSHSGMTVGQCFKCKGKGTLTFKTSPEARAAARNANERKAAQKAESLRANAVLWKEANAADWAWIEAKRGSFDFAAAMSEALTSYGTLTEKQQATVTRLRLRDEERKVEAVARAANAPVVSVAKIEEAFDHARGKGIKSPKLRLAGYKFSCAPAHGANAGALYVVRVEDDQYLGKIKDGRFNQVRECTPADAEAIIRVCSDPHAEAIAYGKRTGNCCVCGRELTNHASIDLGIGPICAEKFGWA